MKFFCGTILVLFFPCVLFSASTADEKNIDLIRLEEAILSAKGRIADTSRIHGSDFLQLLPTVSVSRRATADALADNRNETYIGLSVSSSQLWNISDRASARKAARERGLRAVACLGFQIRTLIDRKYLLKERLWKLKKIRASLENPVEIASYDEKIDEQTIALQECEIAIEKGFAEIEFAVVEAGR